jgi:hypothetical protein
VYTEVSLLFHHVAAYRRVHTPYDMLLHHQKIWLFTVLISDFNREQYELPEGGLEMDQNTLEHFKCFNATIWHQYIIIYS